eukprot:299317_1
MTHVYRQRKSKKKPKYKIMVSDNQKRSRDSEDDECDNSSNDTMRSYATASTTSSSQSKKDRKKKKKRRKKLRHEPTSFWDVLIKCITPSVCVQE